MSGAVLIIDDDAALLELMAGAFRAIGFSVTTAENGRKGLRLAEAVRPDLVVTDIVMPDVEGIGLIRSLRQFPRAPRVIAISGALRGRDYLSWAGHLGADEVLAKPFRLSELLRISKRMIETAPHAIIDLEGYRAHSSR